MTPLPLPTDNLYKFCALAGLAVMAISLYSSWSITNELFKLEGQQALAQEKANVETEFFGHEWEVIKREYSDLLWNQNRPPGERAPDDKLRVPLTASDYSKQLDTALENGKRAMLNEKEINSRQVEIRRLSDERMLVRWITAAGTLGGFALSVYGFRNWRILQLHQDRLFLAQRHLPE